MPTVPGRGRCFPTQAVIDAGGVSDDTLAEDTDLTMAVIRAGWRVVFEEQRAAWTEAPANLDRSVAPALPVELRNDAVDVEAPRDACSPAARRAASGGSGFSTWPCSRSCSRSSRRWFVCGGRSCDGAATSLTRRSTRSSRALRRRADPFAEPRPPGRSPCRWGAQWASLAARGAARGNVTVRRGASCSRARSLGPSRWARPWRRRPSPVWPVFVSIFSADRADGKFPAALPPLAWGRRARDVCPWTPFRRSVRPWVPAPSP